jgi:hypothetical protein
MQQQGMASMQQQEQSPQFQRQLQLEGSLHSSFACLAASCMDPDPAARPTFADIAQLIDKLRQQQLQLQTSHLRPDT